MATIIQLSQREVSQFSEIPFSRLSLQNQKEVAIQVLNARGTSAARRSARLLTDNIPAVVPVVEAAESKQQ